MSIAKVSRPPKRQLGQFLTPQHLAEAIVGGLDLDEGSRVLEPGFGDGAFLVPLVRRFLSIHRGEYQDRLRMALTQNIFGVEIDETLFDRCLTRLVHEFGELPDDHNLARGDFLTRPGWNLGGGLFGGGFTHVVGNPPFGATIDPFHQDALDRLYGLRMGQKIKKESYSFFIVKSLDYLGAQGSITFICSDTFLSINTMRGLRDLLLSSGVVEIDDVREFSNETVQPMVVLRFTKSMEPALRVFGTDVPMELVQLTDNHSWLITHGVRSYFQGPRIGAFMTATGGMTTGRNELFVREIRDGRVIEPYEFLFCNERITLAREVERARLGKIPDRRRAAIAQQEATDQTVRMLDVRPRDAPLEISLPHPDYCYFNKATGAVLYAAPRHAIFWRDDGEAVKTFKRTGNWYLRGVGGQKYFGREGITWQLVASRLNARYLPPGYVLDSGAPCAFLKPGVQVNELYFILGWALTSQCSRLLKGVINHTRNIQGKDFERLPYPQWVSPERKERVISRVKAMINEAMRGRTYQRGDQEFLVLEDDFSWSARNDDAREPIRPADEGLIDTAQLPIW